MITIRKLVEKDCSIISAAFAEQGWDKPPQKYQTYFNEQQNGQRTVLIAEFNRKFAGYLTICWKSDYPPFRARKIPEIVDLNVLKKFQKRGTGTLLMDRAEGLAAEKSKVIGIGVGLFSDYGKAQRLYVKRGYVPDGLGIWQNGKFLKYGDEIRVDDGLILYFTKNLF